MNFLNLFNRKSGGATLPAVLGDTPQREQGFSISTMRAPNYSGPEIKATAAQPRRGRLYEYEFTQNERQELVHLPAPVIPMTPKLFSVAGEGKEILSEKNRRILINDTPKLQALVDTIMQYSFGNIPGECKARRLQYEELLAAGKKDEAEKIGVIEPADLYKEYDAKKSAAQRAHRQLQNSHRPIYQEIANNLAAAALEKHDALVAEEKERAEELGFDYQPNSLIKGLGQMSWRVHAMVPGEYDTNYNPPASMCARFGIKL